MTKPTDYANGEADLEGGKPQPKYLAPPNTTSITTTTQASHRFGSQSLTSHPTPAGHRTTWRRDADARVVGLKDYGLAPSMYAKRQQPLPAPVSPHQHHHPDDVNKSDSDDSHSRATSSVVWGSDPVGKSGADSHVQSTKKKKKSSNRRPRGGAKRMHNKLSVEEKEEQVRLNAITNPCQLMYLGNLAAIKVMLYYLITLETLVSCTFTVGLTCYWYYRYAENNNNEATLSTWQGGGMSFVLLAFALTAPMSAALTIAFTRRERALITIAELRSWSYHLYMAHSLWDWPGSDGIGSSGRAEAPVDWVEHCDAVMAQLVGIGDELARFLSLPTTSRSRHRMTQSGRKEASKTIEVAYHLLQSMASQRTTRLTFYSERIKKLGLPSGEVSRIRQFERYLSSTIEQLRMVKMYRTPQAFRSFARIFTLVLPPFYAPTYAQVGQEVHSLGVGIAFGIITALGLTALFESLQILEDPFTAFLALDGIDVCEEFEVLHFAQLYQTRNLAFPNAQPYPPGRRAALTVSIVSSKKKRSTSYVGCIPKQEHHLAAATPVVLQVTTSRNSNTAMPTETETTEMLPLDHVNETHVTTMTARSTKAADLNVDLELGTPLDEEDTVRATIFADGGADVFEDMVGTASDMSQRPRLNTASSARSSIRARHRREWSRG